MFKFIKRFTQKRSDKDESRKTDQPQQEEQRSDASAKVRIEEAPNILASDTHTESEADQLQPSASEEPSNQLQATPAEEVIPIAQQPASAQPQSEPQQTISIKEGTAEISDAEPMTPSKAQPQEQAIFDERAHETLPKPQVFTAELEPQKETKDQPDEQEPIKKKGWFARIKDGLSRTRENLTEGLANLFLGKKEIDDDLFEALETQLLLADVGVQATTDIMKALTDRVKRKELQDPQALHLALKQELADILSPIDAPLVIPENKKPYVILVVGVNGAGKTTTIGKLAKRFSKAGKSVMLAAGDTFRAAAVEQLQVWGERNKIPVIAQHTGADSASVIFDALKAAENRNVDVLIADTAGRLHNKANLMEELKKVHRVMGKFNADAPDEVLLVLDATAGQNALVQAEQFHSITAVSGIVLTKLDGTAKGGIIFAIAKKMGLPIRFIGVGEQIDDLRPFVADEFIGALFTDEHKS